jgi:hypothetical protein
MFILLAIWGTILATESPFASVCVSSKNAKILGVVNSLFILSFWLWSRLFIQRLGIYSIPVAYSLSQAVSLFFFTVFALRIIGTNTLRSMQGALDRAMKNIHWMFL